MQPFNRFLYERHGVVSDLLEKCDQHLDAIVEIIGDYECIPGDMVLAPVEHFLKSISSNVQYVTLQKYFSHPSSVIHFFRTQPIKLKLRLQIGGRLLIANHLDQSLQLTHQK